MKYKVWVQADVRGSVIVAADNIDEAAHKAQAMVARKVDKTLRVERGNVYFVAVKAAGTRDVASHAKRRRR